MKCLYVQGVRPQSFEKVENSEIRDIIDQCTRLHKEDRPSVKDLLNHEFFAEETGLKVEVVSRDEAVASSSTRVEFRLRVLDPKKRRDKHKENEAIQFEFDVLTDDADELAFGMVGLFFFFLIVFSLKCTSPPGGTCAS